MEISDFYQIQFWSISSASVPPPIRGSLSDQNRSHQAVSTVVCENGNDFDTFFLVIIENNLSGVKTRVGTLYDRTLRCANQIMIQVSYFLKKTGSENRLIVVIMRRNYGTENTHAIDHDTLQ